MQKILKNERGSVALFVLLSALFFLVVVTGVAVSFKNKEAQIDSQIEKIKTSYAKEAEQVYDEKVSRTVTFDANGGEVGVKSKVVKIGDTYGELPIPTREGYTFKGWNGKNMFDEEKLLMAISGATYTDNHYVFSFVNAYNRYGKNGNSLPIIFKENTQYTYSVYGYVSGTNNIGLAIAFSYAEEGTENSQLKFNQNDEMLRTLVSRKDKTIKRNWMSYGAGNSAYISHIQLEEGEISTEFEPYYITSSTKVTQNNDDSYVLTAIWEPNE